MCSVQCAQLRAEAGEFGSKRGGHTGLLNVNEAKISELIRMWPWGVARVNLAKLSEKRYEG